MLVLSGCEKTTSALTLEDGAALVQQLRDGGMKLKDAARRVSDDTGLSRNALYTAALHNVK